MKKKLKYLIGVDEAGRGPLAGPITVAALAVKLKTNPSSRAKLATGQGNLKLKIFKGIRDSKKFSEKQREEWFARLKKLKNEGVIDYAVSFSGAKIIDEKGIVVAVRRALARAIRRINVHPNSCQILLDGTLYAPPKYKNQKTIIRGDDNVPIIAAASIIAKVRRDRRMKRLAKKFPKYGFEIHKGYGTRAHYRALKKLGPSEIHRRSFL